MNWEGHLFKILKITDLGGFLDGRGFISFGRDLGRFTGVSEKKLFNEENLFRHQIGRQMNHLLDGG